MLVTPPKRKLSKDDHCDAANSGGDNFDSGQDSQAYFKGLSDEESCSTLSELQRPLADEGTTSDEDLGETSEWTDTMVRFLRSHVLGT